MKVYLDTSILYTDPYIEKPQNHLLFQYLRFKKYKLFIPEVVLDELSIKITNEARNVINKIKNLEKLLNRFLPRESLNYQEKFIWNDTYKECNLQILKKLKEFKVEIVSYPKVSHKDIVFNEMNQVPPFRKDREGYRDYLIWKTILANIEDGEDFAILSKNHKDFGEEPKLLSEFQDELKKTKPSSHGTVYNSINSFFESIIPEYKPSEKKWTDFENRELLGNFSLKNWILEHLAIEIYDGDLKIAFIGTESGSSSIYITDVLRINNCLITEIENIGELNRIIDCYIDINVNLSISIDAEDYNTFEEIRNFTMFEEEFMETGSSTWWNMDEDIRISVILEFNYKTGQCISSEIKTIDTVYGSVEL